METVLIQKHRPGLVPVNPGPRSLLPCFFPATTAETQPQLQPDALRLSAMISDALPFGRLWYSEVRQAIDFAKHQSRSHDAVIRVYDAAGNVIEAHEHVDDFKQP